MHDAYQDTSVGVQIDLGAELAPFATIQRLRDLEDRVASKVQGLLAELGIDVDANVTAQVSDATQAVRVRIGGAPQPYPPDLIRRTWLDVAPPSLWDLPERTRPSGQSGFPDAWFREHVTSIAQSTDAAAWQTVADFLTRIAYEVIHAGAEALAGPMQVDEYLRRAARELHESDALPDRRLVQPVLQTLIGLGVWPGNHRLLLQTIADTASGRVEDAIESSFVTLRSKRIEIHVNPTYLKTLVHSSASGSESSVYDSDMASEVREMFRFLEEGLFYELGLTLPDLVWVHAEDLREQVFSVKINDRMGLPTLGLRAGELLVNDTVERLQNSHGVVGRRARNPASGYENAIVPDSNKESLETAGLTTWTPVGFVVLALAHEIRRCAAGLLGIDDVGYYLGILESVFPETVHAALVRMTFADITRVLRALLAEGISIRDLRTILERLSRYETVIADPAKEVVFDDRLLISDMARSAPPGLRQYVEFVRGGLKQQIGYKYARGTDTVVVYLLDPRIERLLAERTVVAAPSERAILDEVERNRILQAVWFEMSFLPPAAMMPSILTTQDVRATLRDVVSPEFPGLSVLSYQELPPELNVQPVARIGYTSPGEPQGAGT